MKEESVCIQDFCGSGHYTDSKGVEHRIYPCQFWADYWTAQHVTTFGGYWSHVPNMPSDTEPTEEQVQAWANKYGDWVRGYEEEF